MAQVQIGTAFSGVNPAIAGAVIDGGTPNGGTPGGSPGGDGTIPSGGSPSQQPAGQITYGQPSVSYNATGTGAPCCDINWWWVALAAVVGGVIGYLVHGQRRS